MHPAFSVIFFTTASGAGYGLLALMGLFGAMGMLPADNTWFAVIGLGLALALISAGLLSSTFHLGHPERAWRAVTQWRSSWLAREGVMAILTYIPAGLFFIGWVFVGSTDGFWGWMGGLSAVLAGITVWCTSMIYASLKTIPRWNHILTGPVYLLLAVMTGAILLACLTLLFGVYEPVYGWLAAVSTLVAWLVKQAYWTNALNRTERHTTGTATGLGRMGPVKSFEHPHTEENYLLKEMGHQVARKHADKLRNITLLTLFWLPLVLAVIIALVGAGGVAAFASVLAVLSAGAGVVVERWLFFAEAKHVVTLYYNARAA